MKAIDWCELNDIQTEDLDDIVHEAASDMASNSNNEGIAGQIEFLQIIAGWGNDDIIETLRQQRG